MRVGQNCALTPSEVEQAVKIRAYELCRGRKVAVPDNLIDFLNRSTVHWAQRGAMITWEL